MTEIREKLSVQQKNSYDLQREITKVDGAAQALLKSHKNEIQYLNDMAREFKNKFLIL